MSARAAHRENDDVLRAPVCHVDDVVTGGRSTRKAYNERTRGWGGGKGRERGEWDVIVSRRSRFVNRIVRITNDGDGGHCGSGWNSRGGDTCGGGGG